ncbi:hypothetical protein RAD04_09590 [Bradyrhizobium sp. 25ACV]
MANHPKVVEKITLAINCLLLHFVAYAILTELDRLMHFLFCRCFVEAAQQDEFLNPFAAAVVSELAKLHARSITDRNGA